MAQEPLGQPELEFFATCLAGLERPLADELRMLGIERVRPLAGGVAFFCASEQAYRACLWSRLASRIMLVLDRVDAGDAELLYAGVYEIAWEDVLSPRSAFAVRARGTNESLRNTHFTELKVKDALVDRLRSKGWSPGSGQRAAIDVRVRDRRATISLDFSGEALNRRSYLADDDGKDAALKCSKAAGILALAGWTAESFAGRPFVDPACRDGVLLVEAASIACDRASGLDRERWGFRSWASHDEELWQSQLAEARRRFEAGLCKVTGLSAELAASTSPPDARHVRFFGASGSSPMISRARAHVKRAGLRQAASIERLAPTPVSPAFIASDLDAQSRADAPAEVLADEAAFVAACSAAPEGSRFAVAGGNDLAARFDGEPAVRCTMGTGRIETVVEVFDERPAGGASIEIADLAGGAPHKVDVLEPTSEQFAARLRKVFKERRKWAAREGVTCYRVYDSDLPDYAVAIDRYAGVGASSGNDYLHVSEYAAPASIDEGKARRRFNDVLAIAPIVCGVRPDHVFAKRRVRSKGGGQYRNAGARPYVTTVEEGGCRFEVDLASRLDTGLFLDHRITRALVRDAAAGARFLNLFAYTGSASVYAAAGGAVETTTVDLSQTYLDWARRNMAANGFAGKRHAFERADVLKWVTQARRAGKRYDLIFVDPPTFSNSKAMGRKTWDVQRDHAELLIGIAHLLAEGGQAIFSCNLRSFKPDSEKLATYGVELEDISLDTIPADFARTPKIHKCYRVRKTASVKRKGK